MPQVHSPPSGVPADRAQKVAIYPSQDVVQVTSVTGPPAPAIDIVDVCEVGYAESKKTASFTDQEVQVLHRFYLKILPSSDAGLAPSGRDLARQLKELIKKHVGGSVREQF